MAAQDLRPKVIVPDTAPLIHLAAGDALDILPALGRVVVLDIIALEATWDLGKPFARDIADWIEAGSRPGANGPVEVLETDFGDYYRIAAETGLKRPRGVGDLAIVRWLLGFMDEEQGPALVVYEDKRIPQVIAAENLTETVLASTT